MENKTYRFDTYASYFLVCFLVYIYFSKDSDVGATDLKLGLSSLLFYYNTYIYLSLILTTRPRGLVAGGKCMKNVYIEQKKNYYTSLTLL